jgi:toxin ParE1/3/4
MQGYRQSAQAGRDYREILAFTLNQWGVEQFNTYASMLDDASDHLVELPLLGVRRDDIQLGLYRYKVGQHYIYYRIGSEHIEIARILHIRRKVTAGLFKNITFYG